MKTCDLERAKVENTTFDHQTNVLKKSESQKLEKLNIESVADSHTPLSNLFFNPP